MATTDSNGLVLVDDTDSMQPLHPVLNSITASVSNAFNKNVRTYNVANIAERTALFNTIGPGTTAKPVRVWRADAPAGRQEEFNVTGSNATGNWHYVKTSQDSRKETFTTLGGGFTGFVMCYREGGTAIIQYDLTGTVTTDTQAFTLPVLYHPSITGVLPGAEFTYGNPLTVLRPTYISGTSNLIRVPGQAGITRRAGIITYPAV